MNFSKKNKFNALYFNITYQLAGIEELSKLIKQSKVDSVSRKHWAQYVPKTMEQKIIILQTIDLLISRGFLFVDL